MQLFIHRNFFCQEYKFTLLYLLDQSLWLPKIFRESIL